MLDTVDITTAVSGDGDEVCTCSRVVGCGETLFIEAREDASGDAGTATGVAMMVGVVGASAGRASSGQRSPAYRHTGVPQRQPYRLRSAGAATGPVREPPTDVHPCSAAC